MGMSMRMDSNVKFSRIVTVTFDHPSVSANTSESNPVTIPGLEVGDCVIPFPPAHTADFVVGQALVCTAANTLDIISANADGSTAVDPASGTWTFLVFRPESVDAGALSA